MQVYRDITLLPGDDIGHHFLWEKVFCQVPDTSEVTVRTSRLQTKSNVERLIRRAAHRQNISLEEARTQHRNTQTQLTSAPYIWVKSLSSGEHFRLFIQQEVGKRSQGLEFTLYGLAISEMEGSLPYF